jgi:hypothetical protein
MTSGCNSVVLDGCFQMFSAFEAEQAGDARFADLVSLQLSVQGREM